MRNKRTSNILSWFLIIPIVFFSYFKDLSFADTSEYINYFNSIVIFVEKNSFFSIHGRFELGFEFFTKVVVLFGFSFRFFFAAITMLNLLIMKKILNRFTKFICIGLLIYTSFYGTYYSFVILRAGLATVLFLYAITCFNNRKILKYALFVAAFSFHYSILFAIAIYIFVKIIFSNTIKFKSNILFDIVFIFFLLICHIFAFGGILIYFFRDFVEFLPQNNYIIQKFMSYLNAMEFAVNFKVSTRLLLNIVVFILLKSYFKFGEYENKIDCIFCWMSYLAIIISCIFGTDTFVGRLVDQIFFSIGMLMIIYFSRKINYHNLNYKNAMYGILIGVYCVLNIIFSYRFLIIDL